MLKYNSEKMRWFLDSIFEYLPLVYFSAHLFVIGMCLRLSFNFILYFQHGVNRVISELPEIKQTDSQMEPLSESTPDAKLPFKRTRNELSGTSVNTLDSSSCDEGTMIGSSSDEAPKECTSSVSSLKSMLADAINEQPDDWSANKESSPTTSSMDRYVLVAVPW